MSPSRRLLAVQPGVYALLLHVPEAVTLRVRSGHCFAIATGPHIYVGSARGPGGLVARIGRHLRGGPPHWHLDYLRPHCTVEAVAGFTAVVEECALAAALLAQPGTHGVAGFGCSDCRCPTYLIALADDASVDPVDVLAEATAAFAGHRIGCSPASAWNEKDAHLEG